MVIGGVQEGKITLHFAFDVSPEDIQSPVTVILIDGDGSKTSGEGGSQRSTDH
jgi:hypothetical protein